MNYNEAWRVADGAWFVDVGLGEGVEFDEASRIVLAIRNGALVNALDSESEILDYSPTDFDAALISRISKAEGPGAGFRVAIGKSALTVLWVRLVDATVELYRYQFYTF